MNRLLLILTIGLVFQTRQVIAQKDSLEGLTGVYQPRLDPSVEFVIKKKGRKLLLEIPGQGQTGLEADGPDQFRPQQIPVRMRFIRDSTGKAERFEWMQQKGAQPSPWTKLPGEDTKVVSGRYGLKNNPYKMLVITQQGGQFFSKTNEGIMLPMQHTGDRKFEVVSGGYTIWYEFMADKDGNISTVSTMEGGVLDVFRARDYDPVLEDGFDRPNGFTRADTLRGMLTPLRTCYDVLFYSLDVEVTPLTRSVKGQNTIRFRVEKPFDQLQIDLYANMQIEKILYHQQELTYTREYNAVFVRMPQTLDKGKTDSITIFYKGKPQIPNATVLKGGFLWYNDREGNFWIQTVCQGSGASLWWPCKDHLSDEPDSMKISVTVPGHLMEISNGKLTRTTSIPGNRKRYEWYVSYPINNYNVAINIGNYRQYMDTLISGRDTLPLHYYYLAYNEAPARKIFSGIKAVLGFFERSFGGYPFKRDGFTLMEALYPMEHQGAVSMGPINNPFWSEKIDYGEVTRTAWHEIAHEWWGNNVTEKDIADIWIHEAFATYAEAMVVEFLEGKEAAMKKLRKEVPENREPVIGAYHVNNFRLGDVYPKGCMMLHTLRSVIDNDSVWFSLLRSLQQHFRYQTVETNDVVGYISRILNKDMTAFFDQYLRHSSLPELQLIFSEAGKDLEVRYRWMADEKRFDMPVKVTLAANKLGFIYPDANWKTVIVKRIKQKDFKVDTENFLVTVLKN